MPEVREYTVFQFEELSERAKETARDWLRGLLYSDSSDWDYIYDDAEQVAACLGIEINSRSGRTVGGGTYTEPTIYFSGFSSQGDGACFEGSYSYRKGMMKALADHIGKETDENKGLYEIARDLQMIQRKRFYRLSAKMTHSGHYYHSGCMSVEVSDDNDTWGNASAEVDDEVTRIMRAFADWIYKQLQDDYWWKMEDEQIDEAIEANGYTFDEEGNRTD